MDSSSVVREYLNAQLSTDGSERETEDDRSCLMFSVTDISFKYSLNTESSCAWDQPDRETVWMACM